MSLMGYFSRAGNGGLTMPVQKDSVGIVYTGAVLTGRKSVEDALRPEAVRAEDCDAVLRAHLGIQ